MALQLKTPARSIAKFTTIIHLPFRFVSDSILPYHSLRISLSSFITISFLLFSFFFLSFFLSFLFILLIGLDFWLEMITVWLRSSWFDPYLPHLLHISDKIEHFVLSDGGIDLIGPSWRGKLTVSAKDPPRLFILWRNAFAIPVRLISSPFTVIHSDLFQLASRPEHLAHSRSISGITSIWSDRFSCVWSIKAAAVVFHPIQVTPIRVRIELSTFSRIRWCWPWILLFLAHLFEGLVALTIRQVWLRIDSPLESWRCLEQSDAFDCSLRLFRKFSRFLRPSSLSPPFLPPSLPPPLPPPLPLPLPLPPPTDSLRDAIEIFTRFGSHEVGCLGG